MAHKATVIDEDPGIMTADMTPQRPAWLTDEIEDILSNMVRKVLAKKRTDPTT